MKYLLFVMRVSNAIVKIAEASLYKKKSESDIRSQAETVNAVTSGRLQTTP